MQFIPNKAALPSEDVPYFENASTAVHGIRGHETTKSIQELQRDVSEALARLGGSVTAFIPGTFPTTPKRYGYRIEFFLGPMPGRIDVAGLPFKYQATKVKKTKAMKQALFTVAMMFEAELNGRMMLPGQHPLVPYLIGAGGQTVTEALVASGNLPMLEAG